MKNAANVSQQVRRFSKLPEAFAHSDPNMDEEYQGLLADPFYYL